MCKERMNETQTNHEKCVYVYNEQQQLTRND